MTELDSTEYPIPDINRTAVATTIGGITMGVAGIIAPEIPQATGDMPAGADTAPEEIGEAEQTLSEGDWSELFTKELDGLTELTNKLMILYQEIQKIRSTRRPQEALGETQKNIIGEFNDKYKQFKEDAFKVSFGNYSLDAAGRLVSALIAFDSVQNKQDSIIALRMLERIPTKYLQDLYLAPEQQGVNTLRSIFGAQQSRSEMTDLQLRLLAKIYGDKIHGVEWRGDKNVQQVEHCYSSEAAKKIALLPLMPDADGPDAVSAFNNTLQKEAAEILVSMGLSERMIQEYLTAANVKLRYDDKSESTGATLNAVKLKRELYKIQAAVELLGADMLTRMHTYYGMENPWMYSVGQLQLLSKLIDKDPATIEHLKGGDVTVVFTDARSDWNGALVDFNDYDSPSGRTIRFEVNNPANIYRQMIHLNTLGIKPSTFVYEAHGSPGITQAGRDGLSFTSFDNKQEAGFMIPIPRTQLGRLVREFMQTNRGIDGPTEAIGTKRVILKTCSGDVPLFIQEEAYDSVAESVTKTIADPSVRVFAAGAVMRQLPVSSGVEFIDDATYRRGERKTTLRELRVEVPDGNPAHPNKTTVHRGEAPSIRLRNG